MRHSNLYSNRCVIYVLRNTTNDKVYIGQTWRTLKERWNKGYRKKSSIDNAIKKHGEENFYYEVLLICHDQVIADYWETYFIEKYDSCNRTKGYNLRRGGSRGKHSAQTKKRMSVAQKGREVSEETRAKLSQILLDNPIKMFGEDNPMFGKTGEQHHLFGRHHTAEAKQKMSAKKKGKPGRKGWKHSATSRLKMSETKKHKKLLASPKPPKVLKGKPHSEEAKAKISNANKGQVPHNKGKKKNPLTGKFE